MENKYTLVVTDIDGTLTDKDGIISDIDLQALRRIHQAGVAISLCTGRAACGCSQILNQLAIDGYHIFFDGALIANSSQNKAIYSQPVQEELILQVYQIAQANQLTLELFSPTQFFVNHYDPLADLHGQLMNFNPCLSDLKVICHQATIILGCLPTHVSEEKRILTLYSGIGENLRFSSTRHPACPDVRFINIIHKEVSKGKALDALMSHLGIQSESVMAIGDGPNDISLLSRAGLAIAMENAPGELKAEADYITADVEHNGIAKAINRFFG
jgi:Cof subfamily protein (haloacid dehalogenase superfamily)